MKRDKLRKCFDIRKPIDILVGVLGRKLFADSDIFTWSRMHQFER